MTDRRPRRSEPIGPEHLAALKALRRAGLDPTVLHVTANTDRRR
jgi:hypothetical protein